ncbi:LysR substrate-binding domain-containing protein [Sphingobium sp. DC-2]|uniref:LysR substrate-binding domain-containing protein n=1 Tax=Sphingobium sp. DC-2 TaxID=1303256 RepID=UPI0004C41E95|nr:LysR substrate-binding domain-containing protein [Sphingobium sp. DC-2]
MDLKRLENFLRVAELGSLSRAADRLRVAQPALSRQMRMLEVELGTQLFARHRRGMGLTPAGEELRLKLAGPLRQIRQTLDDAQNRAAEAGGLVALGLPPTVSYILAGRLMSRVARHSPNISLRIVEGYAGHLIDWLQRGEIDTALLYGPASDFQMKVEDLLFEQLMLVGSGSCDLDPARPVPVRALSDLPLALPSQPHGLRMVIENAANKAKATLKVKFEADSFLVLKEIAELGLGYTTLPFSAVRHEVEAGRLKYAPLAEPTIMRQLVLGSSDQHQLSRAAQTVIRLLREEIRDLVQQGLWRAQLQY